MRTLSILLLLAGCDPVPPEPPPPPVGGDVDRYLDDVDYRRGVLLRDLVSTDNDYARQRLQNYGRAGSGWEVLPPRDPAARPLTLADSQAWEAGTPIGLGEATTFVPDPLPASEDDWIALGERVFYGYPLRVDSTWEAAVSLGVLGDVGFLLDEDEWVGLATFREDGRMRIGPTCAQCHASRAPDGGIWARLANRDMDIGAARLLVMGLTPGDLPPEIDSTATGDLDRLGPGRADVLSDGRFNPYAFPDFGGLGDLPLLHHTANWRHADAATLAVRCETLFITSVGQRYRIPRALSWALAAFLRSIPPPPPGTDAPDDEELAGRGEQVFAEQGCDGCHPAPLYTSDRPIPLSEVGTDPGAGSSQSRYTGSYRAPSLRGVARTAPYLHHGAFDSLAALFEPGRQLDEPGHEFGLELDDADRAALLAFLQTI